jgi:diguanylate cyclase (GGDEF)-like protein
MEDGTVRRGRGTAAPHALFAAVALAACMGAAAAAYGHFDARRIDAELLGLQRQQDQVRELLLVLSEGEAAIRGALAFGGEGHVAPLQAAVDALAAPGSAAAAALVDGAIEETGEAPVAGLVAEILQRRRHALAALTEAGAEGLRATGALAEEHGRTEEAAGILRHFLALRATREAMLRGSLRVAQGVSLVLVLASIGLTLVALGISWLLTRWRAAAEAAAQEALARRSGEIGSLLRMSELLQACHDPGDVERVVAYAAGEVLPGVDGAFYAFSEARDRLDRVARWGAGSGPADHFGPGECWALKRGRPHGCGAGGLGCVHGGGQAGALCVPMAAGGEVHGVLQFAAPAMDARPGAAQLAAALADGVSLALANLALREKLRAQALRDPLTGLHNRRYLEEIGLRLAQQARRRGSPVSVAMVDIDHFKKLNDTHGHAVGDAVLREVAKSLPGVLRRTDIACRYGGEEFILLLPDAALEQARERMEEVRQAVAAIGDGREGSLPDVTVSIGVAAMPETAGTLSQAIRQADEALYAAKAAGRDRVETAPRPRPEEVAPLRVVEPAAP